MFTLRKWYVDAIAPDGELLIGYRAELRWKAIAIGYASVLHCEAGGAVRTRTTVRRCDEPRTDGDRLHWQAAPLEVSGTWSALAPPVSATILDGPNGAVKWTCLQPRARVQAQLPDGRALDGLGYAELLTLTIAPWAMPIDELRWGRFAGERHSLVWIDWIGPHRAQHVYLDGVRCPEPSISDERVEAGDAVLRLDRETVLRDGAIGDTALAIIPNLRSLFPGRIVGLQETKWRSRATLSIAGEPDERGHAIHEVVRWP